MPSTYITKQDDTWDQIAISEMGAQSHMGILILANPGEEATLVFSPGVSLTIPDAPTPDADDTLPPWRA